MRTSKILENELENTYGLTFTFRNVPEYMRVNLLASYIHQLPVMCSITGLEPKDISLGGMNVVVENSPVHYYGAYRLEQDDMWLNANHPEVFAHEWFHAADYRLGKMLGFDSSVSKEAQKGNMTAVCIFGDEKVYKPLVDRCREYDRKKADYTSRIDEVAARSFERYVAVAAKGRVPMLLDMQAAKEADDPAMLCSAIYPHRDEIPAMARPAMDLVNCAVRTINDEKQRQEKRETKDLAELRQMVDDYQHSDEFVKPFILNRFASKAESIAISKEKTSRKTMDAIDGMFHEIGADLGSFARAGGFDRER